jgi:hypothetical protein
MRAGTYCLGLLWIGAMIGCEPTATTSQRVPAPAPTGAAPEAAPAAQAPPSAPADGYDAGTYSTDSAAQPQQPAAAQPTDASQPANVPPAIGSIPGVNPGAAAAPADAAAIPPGAQPPSQQPIREKAEVGVGVRGDRIESGGIYTTPAKAYFTVRERLTFLQVEQALQFFRGAEGRAPQSNDEFMQKVIQANQIQLPELPPGSRYVWDPQKGELMVERQR